MTPYRPTTRIGMIRRDRQSSEERVLGSETVDDGGEEAADATTLGSIGSFSFRKMSGEDRRRASSFTASVAQLRRWERRVARSTEELVYDGGGK
jgi:hypothetical protein